METGIQETLAEAWTATIWVGLLITDTPSALTSYCEYSVDDAKNICQEFCDDEGWCVSVTPTDFIYTNGREPGVAVGAIGYPRFPTEPDELYRKTVTLARALLTGLEQTFVTITFNGGTDTLMLKDCDRFNLNERNRKESE